jgi:hypothetical protein
MLIFGGELNDFARRLIYFVLVAGIPARHEADRRPFRGVWCLNRYLAPAIAARAGDMLDPEASKPLLRSRIGRFHAPMIGAGLSTERTV